jgi:sulfur carrier protein
LTISPIDDSRSDHPHSPPNRFPIIEHDHRRELIEELGLGAGACASELNRRLVPKKSRAETGLKDGDVVEIVTMVGGG